MSFVHDEDFSRPEFTPEDVRACTDVDQLHDWLEELEDARGDMKAQIEAALLTQSFEPDWMERVRGAYSFANMGAKRIKRRLRSLGVDFETASEVDALRGSLERFKSDLGRARASSAFGSAVVACLKEALPQAAADAILSEAATRITNPGAHEQGAA